MGIEDLILYDQLTHKLDVTQTTNGEYLCINKYTDDVAFEETTVFVGSFFTLLEGGANIRVRYKNNAQTTAINGISAYICKHGSTEKLAEVNAGYRNITSDYRTIDFDDFNLEKNTKYDIYAHAIEDDMPKVVTGGFAVISHLITLPQKYIIT